MIESKKLTELINELAILNRHVRAYPDAHPVVISSLEKLVAKLESVIDESGILKIGVSKSGFLLDGLTVEGTPSVHEPLARMLSDIGILTVTFMRTVDPDDLIIFNRLILSDRDEVWNSGGIEELFRDSGITSISVEGLDPEQLILSSNASDRENASLSIWDRLVSSLLEGSYLSADAMLVRMIASNPSNASLELANRLSELSEVEKKLFLTSTAELIRSMYVPGSSFSNDETLSHLGRFIGALKPDLRRELLFSVFNSEVSGKFGEELLSAIPTNMVIDILHDVTSCDKYTPPMLLSLLNKLASLSVEPDEPRKAVDSAEEHTRTILDSQRMEKFIPDQYRTMLFRVIHENRLPPGCVREIDSLVKELDHHNLEMKVTDILFNIMESGDTRFGTLNSQISELAEYFVSIGDFKALTTLMNRLEHTCGKEIFSQVATDDFMNDIIEGLKIWGREHFNTIREIIHQVGEPFVQPLLDVLATEDNMSLRRFYMDCLADFGETSKMAALERLDDPRWFYLRNLLILLRSFADQDVARAVRKLSRHENPKVRVEAMRILLLSRDAAADQMILKELSQEDLQRQIQAVQLAESSRNPQILQQMLQMLKKGGLDYGFELKYAIVASLAHLSNPQALPALSEILGSRNLLHPVLHNRLKLEIIRSLSHYPKNLAAPILDDLVINGSKEVSQIAQDVKRALEARNS